VSPRYFQLARPLRFYCRPEGAGHPDGALAANLAERQIVEKGIHLQEIFVASGSIKFSRLHQSIHRATLDTLQAAPVIKIETALLGLAVTGGQPCLQ